ncbi:MAG: gliding motility-associated C-terminal domain-containing protein [Bacteroidales bacterium]|nr:gliding motility-associated C-terminal domain-containing protein [Bacteroidales bacterium]MCF8405636.1 gliding motility-associated C-terminal domain-containing protein [Bacteroidales bacterium]
MNILNRGWFLFFISWLFCFLNFTGNSENYYWIGGEGNWSDTLHWQSFNGGLPGPMDDVTFDENSFSAPDQKLVIDIDATCHTMDWSGITSKAVMTGTQKLSISGSLFLIQNFDLDFTGDICFVSNALNNYINTEGVTLNSNVYFDGDGSWELLSPLILYGKSIHLNKGTLQSNGWSIESSSFYAFSGFNKGLILPNSKYTITGHNGVWQADANFSYSGMNGTISFEHNNADSQNTFRGGNASYQNVVFHNHAKIFDSNSFRDLRLNASNTYLFESNKTQTINGILFARGCEGPITIQSTGNTKATLSKNNGDINLFFVSLRSIKAEMNGGSQFRAYYSLDLGNNEGCVIQEESRDMTWVNGTGLWSDTIHWSSTIGGENQDCLPMIYDNVFFNNSSFDNEDTVMVDPEYVEINNMTWEGNSNPIFKNLSSAKSLSIYGSLEFIPSMVNNFNAPVYFKDTLSGQIIKTAGIPFKNDVVFQGINGGWTIVDSLKVNGNIKYWYGNLNIEGDYLKCKTFHSDSAFNRSLNLNSAKIEITTNSPYPAWRLNNENLEFNSGNSEIDFLASGATLYNLGGDTIKYNNVVFSYNKSIARLYSYDTIHGVYNNIDFKSNGYIYGNNTFDTLTFSPGNFYSLQAGKTQTIGGIIDSTGICTGPVLLQSLTPGNAAYISKAEDTLSVEYTAIQDIHTIGDAYFVAYNSNNVGNNTGWDTIYNAAPGKLYWVGGTGDWEDPEHWSLISGGPGGECVPTPYDTVIFDNLSFDAIDQKVSINGNNAFAGNLDWTNALFEPEFYGSYAGTYLHVFGSLWLSQAMNFSFPGYIYFESRNTGEVIETAGNKLHNINNNVYFNGPGGEWTLLDTLDLGADVSCKNIIYYNYGNLNTDGYTLRSYAFYSNSSAQRILKLDSSLVNVCLTWEVRGYNLSMPENQSVIRIDSGMFKHTYGNLINYHNLVLNSDDIPQIAEINSTDSCLFNDIYFSVDGSLQGKSSFVIADDVIFNKSGNINHPAETNKNVFVIDSLLFMGYGEIYGNDSASLVMFDSTGIINGSGSYIYTEFRQDGELSGYNAFDTLLFTPGFSYKLESNVTQTINDSLRILGNDCQSIYLYSSETAFAVIEKDTGSVFGDFIEMQNISALGNAIFDAGQFSENINESNEGWIFHENPYQYELGNDTSILEGDTIYLCAQNFNGHSSSVYTWVDLLTGDTISTDSCIMVVGNGVYSLIVYYDLGEGCYKGDTLTVNCHFAYSYDSANISCNGYTNGYIELNPENGYEPITYTWLYNNSFYSDEQNLYNLAAGEYNYTIIDSTGCGSIGTIELTEPDQLTVGFDSKNSCFEKNNGEILLTPSGGTEPYFYEWSNAASVSYQNNLEPGIYNIDITDINSCPSDLLTIEINELEKIDFTLTGTDLICYNDNSGSIEVSDIGGGTGNYIDYQWVLNEFSYSNQTNLESLNSGLYQLTIMDDLGCYYMNEIFIDQPDELLLDHEVTYDEHGWGILNVIPSGGTEPYDIFWEDGNTSLSIGPLTGGDYFVELSDSRGCELEKSIFVEIPTGIFVPNAFSPDNGDTYNDEFEVRILGSDFTSYDISIYNRYGDQVFATNNPEENWNGKKYNVGSELPVGVYTWVIKVLFADGQSKIESGNISLLR